jgi:hypothetical protein
MQQPEPATDTAFAPRGKMTLEDVLAEDVSELQVSARKKRVESKEK